MDDLASCWKKLSLFDKEGKKLALAKNKKGVEYVLAAKFLTKRSVSIDVVEKTFRLYGVRVMIFLYSRYG